MNIADRIVDYSTDPSRQKCLSFSFDSEREAKKFAKAFTPPKMISVPADSTSPRCFVCKSCFEKKKSSPRYKYLNCRNCGVPICKACSMTWSPRMIPKTFTLGESVTHVQVRVCRPCDWLSNAFCIALLKGRLDDVKALCAKGNVNMRSTFADINGEAMFPVHAAVMGGSLEVLRWLVDTHGCPLVGGRSNAEQQAGVHSVLTSKGRSVMDLALTGRQQKIDILRYFVVEKNMSLRETKDAKQAMGALEVLLRQLNDSGIRGGSIEARDLPNHIEPDDRSASQATSIEDACTLCYEKSMDCVLIPCGHQLCCVECGHHLKKCPVCKVNCSVLRIFRT